MNTKPYYFPFDIINYNKLIPNESYYIKLNDSVIKRYINRRDNIPVSHLKGTFIRLDKTQIITYAVFKNVYIINKEYKPGSCSLFSVKYPEGIIASDSCDTYSNEYKDIKLNEDREVFFDVNRWKFGNETEKILLQNKALEKTNLPKDITNYVKEYGGNRVNTQKQRTKLRKSRKIIKNKINKKMRRYSKKFYKRKIYV